MIVWRPWPSGMGCRAAERVSPLIPDAGHEFWAEKPDVFVVAADRFVRGEYPKDAEVVRIVGWRLCALYGHSPVGKCKTPPQYF